MSIIKVIIWAVVITPVTTIANMILSLPLGIYAQRSWAAPCEAALAGGVPVLEVLRKRGTVAIVYGTLLGALVAGSIALLTRRLVSSHWLFQVFLAIGFFFGAGQLQKRYLATGSRHRLMFGLTGDRTIAVMYGGYSWGAVLGIVALGLWSRFR